MTQEELGEMKKKVRNLDELIKEHTLLALEIGGTQKIAATLLGVSDRWIRYKLVEWGLNNSPKDRVSNMSVSAKERDRLENRNWTYKRKET